MSRRVSLTRRGVLALALVPACILGGLLLGAEELVLLALGLFTLCVCGLVQSAARYARARGNWRLTVALGTADVAVGQPVDLVATLAVAGAGGATPVWLEDPRSCWARRAAGSGRHLGAVVGAATGTGTGAGAERGRRLLANPATAVHVPHLDGGDVVRFAFPVPTARRGIYALDGMRLWCCDSFGLVAQLVTVGPSAIVTVHPAPVAVGVAEDLLRGDPATEDQRPPEGLARPRRDALGDFSGLRNYVPGDRLRLLYWPALARTGELMVRDFEDSGQRRVHMVADVRALLGAEGCERVLAAAAGLGLEVLARSSAVELSTTNGSHLVVGPGAVGEMSLLRALAAVEADPMMPGGRSSAAGPWGWLRRVASRRRARGTSPRDAGSDAARLQGLAAFATSGAPLLVTTEAGARSVPGPLAAAHVVVAP